MLYSSSQTVPRKLLRSVPPRLARNIIYQISRSVSFHKGCTLVLLSKFVQGSDEMQAMTKRICGEQSFVSTPHAGFFFYRYDINLCSHLLKSGATI